MTNATVNRLLGPLGSRPVANIVGIDESKVEALSKQWPILSSIVPEPKVPPASVSQAEREIRRRLPDPVLKPESRVSWSAQIHVTELRRALRKEDANRLSVNIDSLSEPLEHPSHIQPEVAAKSLGSLFNRISSATTEPVNQQQELPTASNTRLRNQPLVQPKSFFSRITQGSKS